MAQFRQQWMAWVLAALLPVTGVVSALEAASMAMPMAPHALAVAPSAAPVQSAAACHGMAATAQHDGVVAGTVLNHDGAKPCCDAGICFCSCAMSLPALVVSMSPGFVPSSTFDPRITVGVLLAAPFAHPFRPPIA